MIEIERDEIKAEYKELLQLIIKNHIIASHTRLVLLKNAHIKDFCEEARHFAILSGTPDFFIHYDVATWFNGEGFQVRVERIGVYENYLEYEKERIQSLHSNPKADGANLN